MLRHLFFISLLTPFLGIAQENPAYFKLRHDSIAIFHNDKIIKQTGDTINGQLEIDFFGLKRIESYEDGWVKQQLSYYSNSNLRWERNYKRGKLEGVYKDWYENGVLWVDGYLTDGQKDSVWTFYLPNGNPDASGRFSTDTNCLVNDFVIRLRFNDQQNGNLVSYDEEFTRHSCLDGPWFFFSNDGVPIKTIVFDKGVVKEMEFGRMDIQIGLKSK